MRTHGGALVFDATTFPFCTEHSQNPCGFSSSVAVPARALRLSGSVYTKLWRWWLGPRACRWLCVCVCVCACVHGTCVSLQVRSSGALSAKVGVVSAQQRVRWGRAGVLLGVGCGGWGGGGIRGWGHPRVLNKSGGGRQKSSVLALALLFFFVLLSLSPLRKPPSFPSPPPSHPFRLLRSVPSVRYHEKRRCPCLFGRALDPPPPILRFTSRRRKKNTWLVASVTAGEHIRRASLCWHRRLPFPPPHHPPVFPHPPPHPPIPVHATPPALCFKLPSFGAAKESREREKNKDNRALQGPSKAEPSYAL
eukprot:Rhum_TRINITY_DN15181_c19_g1::Rhum_TRINITY_DN15181_c19_g1_i1::g.143409::m.143409